MEKVEQKNNQVDVNFEGKFDGEFQYKLVNTNTIISAFSEIMKAVTNDFVGARFVCVNSMAQNQGAFLNARIDDINKFINDKLSAEAVNTAVDGKIDPADTQRIEGEKYSMFQITNLIRNYINVEEASKVKPSGKLSYIIAYFTDEKDIPDSSKFVMPKDKIHSKDKSSTRVTEWIKAWNSKDDYKFLGLTDAAKDFLAKVLPSVNGTTNKPIMTRNGIDWNNAFVIKSVNDLYNMGYTGRMYNIIEVPIDVNKVFKLMYGAGEHHNLSYEYNFVIPSIPSIYNEQIRTNRYMLNVVQIDKDKMEHAATENGIRPTTNKLGFIPVRR